jgi:hypothetical protein
MKWETTKAMLESAKKFAEVNDDLAVKTTEDDIYWYRHYRGLADLLRAMNEKIKELSNVSTVP